MKRVLYISYDGMTDPLGQSQVIPYLKGLSAFGHRIIIVSAEKEDRFLSHEKELRKDFMMNELGWFPIVYSNTFQFISQYATYKRLQRESIKLQEEHHFEVVHCRSYIPSLIGLELKRNFDIKFIFDMRGFWADERVEGKIWNQKNLLYNRAYQYFKSKEKEFLKESDAIISLTQNAKEEIRSWRGLNTDSAKISVIPCCTDLQFFSGDNVDATAQQQLRKQLNIDEKDYVLGYSGSLGTWYLAGEMLKFFKCILSIEPQSKFLFITTDASENLFKLATIAGIPKDKIVISGAWRKQMPLFLSLCHAGIFFIKNTYSKKASSPVKLGEWLAMGIPIVCNSGIGDTDSIIGESEAGILLNELNDEHFKPAAWQLIESHFSKQKIRGVAEQFFSLEQGIDRYHQIYEES